MKIKKIVLILITLTCLSKTQHSISYQASFWFNGEKVYTGKDYWVVNDKNIFKNITAIDAYIDRSVEGVLGFPFYVLFVADEEAGKVRIYKNNLVHTGLLIKNDNSSTTMIDSLNINTDNTIDSVYLVFQDEGLSYWDLLDHSTKVYVNGNLWEEVSDLSSSPEGARHYTVNDQTGLFQFGGPYSAQIQSDDNLMIEAYLVPEDSTGGVINTNVTINGLFNYLNGVSVLPSGNSDGDENLCDVYVIDKQAPDYTLLSDLIKVNNADYDNTLTSLTSASGTPGIEEFHYRGYLDSPADIYCIGNEEDDNVLGFLADENNKRLVVFDGSIGTGYDSLAFPSETEGIEVSDSYPGMVHYPADGIYRDFSLVDSIRVSVNEELWTEVENFSAADSNDKVYVFDRIQHKVTFGNGTNGKIPEPTVPDNKIYYTYYRSPDVLVYDSSFAINNNLPLLRHPKAVAARRNNVTGYVDLYLADSAKVNKYELRGSDILTYRLYHVCEFAADCQPLDLDVYRYQKYGTVTTDLSDVYVYVVDSLSETVKVYSDEQALNPLIDTEPVIKKVIGKKGAIDQAELGYLYRPRNVSVTASELGEDKVDVYVSDSSSFGARVHKFRGVLNELPEIDHVSPTAPLDTSLLELPAKGIFRIFYEVEDDQLLSCRMSLYFDPDSANTGTVLSGNEALLDSSIIPVYDYYDWTIDTSVVTSPDTGYILAVVRDEYGQETYKYSDYPVSISAETKTVLSAVDGFDLDYKLLAQNNANQRKISFYLKNPADVVAVVIKGYVYTDIFDEIYPGLFKDMFRVTSITEGTLFSRFNVGGQVFFNSTPISEIESSGEFTISVSLLNSNTGVSRGGEFASMMIEIDSSAANYMSENADERYQNTMLYIRLSESSVVLSDESIEPDLGVEHLVVYSSLVGDIAHSDSSLSIYGSAPNLDPLPDGRLDDKDILLFVLGWNGNGIEQDKVCDFAPFWFWRGNTPPNIYSKPDGVLDQNDIIAFSLMYSWYSEQFSLSAKKMNNELFKTSDHSFDVHYSLNSSEDSVYIDVESEGDKAFMGGELMIYGKGLLESDYLAGDLLSKNCSPLLLDNKGPGVYRLNFARLSSAAPSVKGSGKVVRVVLPVAAIRDSLSYSLKLYDKNGEEIFRKIGNFDRDELPSWIFKKASIYPNPFKDELHFKLNLDGQGPTKIRIYNITGEKVDFIVLDDQMNGLSEFSWHPSNDLASGVYLVKIEKGKTEIIKKALLLK